MSRMLCRLDRLKADLAGVGVTTVLDSTLVRTAEAISDEFEMESSRVFSAVVATRYFDAGSAAYGIGGGVYGNVDYWESPGGSRRFGSTRAPRPRRLYLTDDLISVTSIAIDQNFDGVYETTLLASDYNLWPYNAAPYRAIDLTLTGTVVYWPNFPRSVQVAGTWGYSNETEDTGLTGTLSDTSDTTITASANASSAIYPGDTLVIESEQVYVSAVSGTTVTVTRAVNGTTAAAHSAKSLLVRRYPRDVEMAVAERVVGLRWDSQGGYSGMASLAGDMSGGGSNATIRASYARWRRAVERYSLPVVA